MINGNIASGKWNELKGKIRSAWGKLTDDEIDTARGDFTTFAGHVQKKYGLAQEDVRSRFNEWIGSDSSEQQPTDRRTA